MVIDNAARHALLSAVKDGTKTVKTLELKLCTGMSDDSQGYWSILLTNTKLEGSSINSVY